MGKASRAKRDRQEQKRLERLKGPPLSVSIVTAPAGDGADGISLASELKLVRAAALYADQIELVSLSTGVLGGVAALGTDRGALLDLLTALDDETIMSMGGTALPEGWRDVLPAALAAADTPLGALIPELRQLDAEFTTGQAGINEVAERLLDSSHGTELIPAIDQGLVTLNPAGLDAGADGLDGILARWLEILIDLLHDHRRHLLFDDSVGSLVRAMIDEGQATPSGLTMKHANEAALGSGLIARLPAFPQAPLDEILTLRNDLTAPLSRYRKAIVKLSEKLTMRSVDPESAAEIDDIYRAEVEPALRELDELFAEHGLVREIARRAAADMRFLLGGGAGVYVALDRVGNIGGLLSATAAAAGPIFGDVAMGLTARANAHTDASKRDLFLLYEANRRLS